MFLGGAFGSILGGPWGGGIVALFVFVGLGFLISYRYHPEEAAVPPVSTVLFNAHGEPVPPRRANGVRRKILWLFFIIAGTGLTIGIGVRFHGPKTPSAPQDGVIFEYPKIGFDLDHNNIVTITNHGQFPIKEVKVTKSAYTFDLASVKGFDPWIKDWGRESGYYDVASVIADKPFELNLNNLYIHLQDPSTGDWPSHADTVYYALRFVFVDAGTNKPYFFCEIIPQVYDFPTRTRGSTASFSEDSRFHELYSKMDTLIREKERASFGSNVEEYRPRD